MGYIFLCVFKNAVNPKCSRRKGQRFMREAIMKTGGAESESKNYIGVFGVQAAQLQLYEEQEERPRQTWNEQVLQILQEAYSS